MSSVVVPDGAELEVLRRELVAHCYRMLGSPFDAQDAAQEALTKAWRHADRYDPARGAYRTWLYGIATNVCLDVLRGRARRLRAMDLAPPAGPSDPLGEVVAPSGWIEPLPDALVAPPDEDPGAVVVARDDVRLAFVAALQHLAARQRAVLLLRDVLSFPASEVAELLATTTPAVNSALQRARARLDSLRSQPDGLQPSDGTETWLLERYVAAFEAQDYDTLVMLLCEDAEMAMPPLVWWLRGRDDIARAWRSDPAACAGTRLLPTRANSGPAFAQYVWSDELDRLEPRSLTVLELNGERIQRLTLYLDTPRWFPVFGFPLTWPRDDPSLDVG